MNNFRLISVVFSACSLLACAVPNASNQTYDRSALNSATRTIEAEIVSKRPVKVNASSGSGASTGAALGAVGGSSLGSNGRDGIAGAITGAVVGAAVGGVMEGSAKTFDAYEYIVKSDVAGLLTLVQTDSQYAVGQKVFVVLGAKPFIVNVSK